MYKISSVFYSFQETVWSHLKMKTKLIVFQVSYYSIKLPKITKVITKIFNHVYQQT